MLRLSHNASKRLNLMSNVAQGRAQWVQYRQANGITAGQRHFADVIKPAPNTKPSISNSKSAVMPGSASPATSEPPPPGAVNPTSPSSAMAKSPTSSSIIPPESIPRTPPPPPSAPKASITPPPAPPKPSPQVETTPPPPPAKPKRRTFRRLLYLALLFGLTYAGSVWYSLVNDNFHDFFTEYVPFGEASVFYFEERAFRRRFPILGSRSGNQTRDTGNKVTIPSKSGVSWNIADDKKASASQSLTGSGKDKSDSNLAKQIPSEATTKESSKAVEQTKNDARSPSALPKEDTSKPESSREVKTETARPEKIAPAIPEPAPKEKATGKLPLVTRIDPLSIKDAEEPVVQDLVKVVNDIITVVNADGSANKYNSALASAKAQLAAIGSRIVAMKDSEKRAAEEKIKASHDEFDQAARELIHRLEVEMHSQESRYRDEFESERAKIAASYEERLKTELDTTKELFEQKRHNELLEQAISLKRKFIDDIKSRVEEERKGRLGKLSDLSSSISELEKLTAEWNGVIDANVQTQHLNVAVDAVRSNLEHTDQPKPFVRELAALKEIANNDPVVNAAISSIEPKAYQQGVSTTAQLIDRFRRVASEVRKASLLPEDAGVASHAASVVLSNFMFKKRGLADGDDVESVLTRTETLLEEGDLDGAAREMNGLQGWAKTLSKDWLGEVRRVLEVQQALDVIATEARLQSLRVVD